MAIIDHIGPEHIGCVDLVCRVYEKEFGIKLDPNPYSWLGAFRHVSEPQHGDIVVMRMRSGQIMCDHVGVMIDSESFLHSMEGFGRTVGRIDGRLWKVPRRIAGFLRYKDGLPC